MVLPEEWKVSACGVVSVYFLLDGLLPEPKTA
jgi:hypothetical protein